MATPLHQRLATWGAAFLGGLLLLGSLADAFVNALSIFTTGRAIVGTCGVIATAVLVAWFLHAKGVSWQLRGQTMTVRRLGPLPISALLGAVALLWLPGIVRVGQVNKVPLVAPVAVVATPSPEAALPSPAGVPSRPATPHPRRDISQTPTQTIINSPGAIQAGGDLAITSEKRLINSLLLRIAVETETTDRPVSEPETDAGLGSVVALFTADKTRIRFATDFRLTDQQVAPTRRRLALVYAPEDPTAMLGKPVDFLATVETVVVNYSGFFSTLGFDTNNDRTIWSCEVLLNGVRVADIRAAVSPPGALAHGQAQMDVSQEFRQIPSVYASAVQP